jgi:hypothetical protein
VVALVAAAGVLLAAVAYTAGRLGYASSGWADEAYWAGQALIVVPVAIRLLSRRDLAPRETLLVITVLAVAEYLVTVCYSPAGFTYVDELDHWRSTMNLMQTGKLFTVNYVLPISPHYPGLEEVTAALASVTGLSIFVSGLIVAGVAHLLFVWVLYLVFAEISRSHRIAGLAVLCYACNSHFESFDSMFIYQTLALPFFGLALLAAWRLGSRQASGPRTGWLILAVLAIAATAVTHHVTSYVLVGALLIFTLAALLTGNWRSAGWTGGLMLLSAAAAGGWLVYAAPGTWAYLQPFATETLTSLRGVFIGGQHASAPLTSVGPRSDRMLAALGVLAVSALLPVGWWRVWRYSRQPWPLAMALMSVSWYGIVVCRLTVKDGSELAGRTATFAYISIAYILAVAVACLIGAAVRWQARVSSVVLLVIVLVLMFDGLANGWPPYWERLPGPYLVAGSERSVSPQEIAGARWALAVLGPGNRFAADSGSYPLLGSYGDQNPLLSVAYLYQSPVYTHSDALHAQVEAVRYVWVDERLSQSLPAGGRYFPIDPRAGTYIRPLPARDLTKFNQATHVSHIYDSGPINIYRLAG